MKTIGLFVHGNKPESVAIGQEVYEFLHADGSYDLRMDHSFPREKSCLDGLDLCITLGGDGALLGIASHAATRRVPILGINGGSLGFLTALDATNWRRGLIPILRGERTILRANLLRCTTGGGKYFALNDVVIKNQNGVRSFDLLVSIDGAAAASYRADGLIIATSLGSTAYNLSAGGAILSPSVQALLITPICPHTLANRSVILSPDSRIRVQCPPPADGHRSRASRLQLCVDGRDITSVAATESIDLSLSPIRATIYQQKSYDYFATIRDKLGWNRR
jgi:NAD+ kinase